VKRKNPIANGPAFSIPEITITAIVTTAQITAAPMASVYRFRFFKMVAKRGDSIIL
jgi:hypothetical protein